MRVVTDVMATFAAAHESFERTEDQQPSDQYITSILEVLVPIICDVVVFLGGWLVHIHRVACSTLL